MSEGRRRPQLKRIKIQRIHFLLHSSLGSSPWEIFKEQVCMYLDFSPLPHLLPELCSFWNYKLTEKILRKQKLLNCNKQQKKKMGKWVALRDHTWAEGSHASAGRARGFGQNRNRSAGCLWSQEVRVFQSPQFEPRSEAQGAPGYDAPRVTAQTCLLQGASAAKSPKPLGYLLFPVSFLQPFKHTQLSSPGPPEANRPKTDMGGVWDCLQRAACCQLSLWGTVYQSEGTVRPSPPLLRLICCQLFMVTRSIWHPLPSATDALGGKCWPRFSISRTQT